MRAFAGEVAGVVEAIAISAPFSPASHDHELRAAEILFEELGSDFAVSLSHRVGALGLLERENATILNASLLGVARGVVRGFDSALTQNSLVVESFLTQNDGTLMSAEEAVQLPVLSLGSGPTNSMRGASSLAQLSDAMVIDVGGTSADVGILVDGFPRESASAIEVGGVRTNFRMPDLISIGLGGGSLIGETPDGVTVGPDSVGYRVSTDARVRGGSTLTLSGYLRARRQTPRIRRPGPRGVGIRGHGSSGACMGRQPDRDHGRTDESEQARSSTHRCRRRITSRSRRGCRRERSGASSQPRGRKRIRCGDRGRHPGASTRSTGTANRAANPASKKPGGQQSTRPCAQVPIPQQYVSPPSMRCP
ncbi:hypothetical protein JM654_07420 [Microbacterium oxydans]|nr:hypothetical protein [Microbacterium oxydans]